jgi:hypothetical protein
MVIYLATDGRWEDWRCACCDPVALIEGPLAVALFALAAIALPAPFMLRGLARFRSAED